MPGTAAEGALPDLGDRYRVSGELGRGAMGRVFAAFDQKLGRQVAIKVLAAGAVGPEAVSRFEQEARAAGSLNHPNIVVVHDIGHTGTTPYIVQELLDGQTLRERLAGGALGADLALLLATQLAQGLAAAHGRGVIHRDLKPENLFVTGEGQLKILDFGVAKLLGRPDDPGAPAHSPDMTRPGAMVGTAGYMSPEQVRGHPADARSDVFAFGAIAYEMLSGKRAFAGASPVETGYAVLNTEPPPLPSSVPAELHALVRRCLQKDPRLRPQSAREIAQALAELRSARSSQPAERGGGLGRRWPAALLAIVVLAAAGTAVILLRGRRATSPPSVAVLPFADLSAERDQEYLADGIAEEILSVLSRVEGLRVPGRTSSFYFKGRNADLKEIGERLRVDHVLEGSVRRSGDRIRVTTQLVALADEHPVWSQTYERAMGDVFAIQDEIARATVSSLRVKLLPGNPIPATRPGNPEAYAALLRGRYFARLHTEEDGERALQAYRLAIELDPTYAEAHAALSEVLRFIGGTFRMTRTHLNAEGQELREARLAAARAVELAPDRPEGYVARAEIRYWQDFDWAGAAADLERALALNPDHQGARGDKAWLLATLGRLNEAIAIAESLLDEDPLAINFANGMGFFYNAAGRHDRARESLIRALETAPGHVRALRELSFTDLYEGRPAEALKVNERNTSDWMKRTVEALAFHDLGREEESRRAIGDLEKEGFDFAYQLVQVYAWRGELDQAFVWLDRARAQRDPGVAHVTYDPLLGKLRGDPRYKAFLRSMNIPTE